MQGFDPCLIQIRDPTHLPRELLAAAMYLQLEEDHALKTVIVAAIAGWIGLGSASAGDKSTAEIDLGIRGPLAQYAALSAPPPSSLPDLVRKYVRTHKPLSIEFGAEPIIGAIVPVGARLRDIPGYHFQYVYVKGRPVFVDGQSRRVVRVGDAVGGSAVDAAGLAKR